MICHMLFRVQEGILMVLLCAGDRDSSSLLVIGMT